MQGGGFKIPKSEVDVKVSACFKGLLHIIKDPV
jgi:hypothetical protein